MTPRPQPLIIYIFDEDDMRSQGCKDFKGEGYYWSYGDQDGIWDATPEGPFKTTIAAYADYARGEEKDE